MNQRLQPFTIENDLQHFYAPAAPTFHVFLIPHPHLDIAIARRYFGWYMYIEKINAHTHTHIYIVIYICIYLYHMLSLKFDVLVQMRSTNPQ